jgi:hypothetical protein
MVQEKVTAIIDKKTGNVKIECSNFVGEGCAAIEQVELMLGTQIKHEDKDERYQYRLENPQPLGQL